VTRVVVPVRDEYDTRETWPFECLGCWHVWEDDYLVRRLTDDYGNEVAIWSVSGVTVQPPWSGTSCPSCGGFQITSFPAGYLSRHPELVPVPLPEPVADTPGVPAMVSPEPAVRAPVGGRLLLALGLPVAAFVGYELYENLVATVRPHS
jgi:hypothetical protein